MMRMMNDNNNNDAHCQWVWTPTCASHNHVTTTATSSSSSICPSYYLTNCHQHNLLQYDIASHSHRTGQIASLHKAFFGPYGSQMSTLSCLAFHMSKAEKFFCCESKIWNMLSARSNSVALHFSTTSTVA